MTRERLQKSLARAGYGSRRFCEKLIESGRVMVNGQVAVLGQTVDPAQDELRVDGCPVTSEPFRHVLLHKPAGVVTTRRDPQGRTTVMDLVPPDMSHLHPVGRLDQDSEGLLLLTNDGPLTFFLTHPRYQVPRVYRALVRGRPSPGTLARLRDGVRLEEGWARAEQVVLRQREGNGYWVQLTLREGRKRQVRRMWEKVEHPVMRLIRVQMGPLDLGQLPPGSFRPLTPVELQSLRFLQRRMEVRT